MISAQGFPREGEHAAQPGYLRPGAESVSDLVNENTAQFGSKRCDATEFTADSVAGNA